MKKIWLILAVVVFVFVSLGDTAFGGLLPGYESLRGAKKFHISIMLYEEIEKFGLTEKQIQTDVELKLRLAGIEFLEKRNLTSSIMLTHPALMIRVFGFRIPKYGFCHYFAEIVFFQKVYLPRWETIPPKPLYATTWQYNSPGRAVSVNDIRNHIKGVTDEFINAYLSVNPK